MALRITQLYLELAHDAVADTDGEVRVTGQYLSVGGSQPRDNPVRVTGEYLSVGGSQPTDNTVRVTGQYLTVGGSQPRDNEFRFTSQLIQVLTEFSVEPEQLKDTHGVSDSVFGELVLGPTDVLACLDSITIEFSGSWTYVETLACSDSLIGYNTSQRVTDTLSCSDAVDTNVTVVEVTDTLSCSDSVLGVNLNNVITDTLACTDSVTFTRPITNIFITDVHGVMDEKGLCNEESITDFHTVTDKVSQFFEEFVTDTLACTDAAEGSYGLDDTHSITDSFGVMMVFSRNVTDILACGDALARQVFWTREVTELLQDVVFNPITLNFEQVGCHDTVLATHDRIDSLTDNLACTDSVTFQHIRVDAIDAPVTDFISCTDSARTVIAEEITDTISCTDSVQDGEQIFEFLGCTDRVETAFIKADPYEVTDTLTCQDYVSAIREKSKDRFQFNPIIGAPVNCPVPPSTLPVTQNVNACVKFQLHSPPINPGVIVNLSRRPEIGNLERISYQRIVRETRAGKLIVFRDKDCWGPPKQSLLFSWSKLTQKEAYSILCFMENQLGEEIGILDHECQYWIGVITTFDDPVVKNKRNDYSVSFEFEGKLHEVVEPSITAAGSDCPVREDCE